MRIHTTLPLSCVAAGVHQPKQWAPNGLGSLVPAAGCSYQPCYRGVPLAPTILRCVCYLLLDVLAHSPEGESSGWSKTTANTGVGTPGCSAQGRAPGSPTLCHLGVTGITQAASRPRCLDTGVTEAQSFAPQTQRVQLLGHITQQGMEHRQQGVLRDTDRETSLSLGISAHSLPQQEHHRSSPSRDELESSPCARISGLWPAGSHRLPQPAA